MKKSSIIIFVFSLLFVFFALSFHEKLLEFKSLGLFGIFVINLIGSATVFVPAPAIASVFAGGLIYPPLPVALVSAVGSAIGEMLGFLLGKSGKDIFLDHRHILYKAAKSLFVKYGSFVIFFGAFIPNPLFDAVGIMAGVFSFSPWRLLILIFLGRFLRNIILAYAGSAV